MSHKQKAVEIVSKELLAIHQKEQPSEKVIQDLANLVHEKQERIEELEELYDVAVRKIIKLQTPNK
jgi:HEPN domain-containing protein